MKMLLGRGIQVSNNVNTCSGRDNSGSKNNNDDNVDVGLCFDYGGTTESFAL